MSDSPTEDRVSMSPLLHVMFRFPSPIVLTDHFHWSLSFRPLLALLPPLKWLSPSTSSSSDRLLSLTGWTMWVVGEVVYPVSVSPKLLFSLDSVGPVSCPRVTALFVACFSVFTRFSVLLVMLTVVALEGLSLLLVFERCLTFTPSTITWPLQVRTSSLPGDKTNTPGAGSAQKNKQLWSLLCGCMALQTTFSLHHLLYYNRHYDATVEQTLDLLKHHLYIRKNIFKHTNTCAAVWNHLTVCCKCNRILCIMPSPVLHAGYTPVDTGMKSCITTPSLLPLSVCFLSSFFLVGPKMYTLCVFSHFFFFHMWQILWPILKLDHHSGHALAVLVVFSAVCLYSTDLTSALPLCRANFTCTPT